MRFVFCLLLFGLGSGALADEIAGTGVLTGTVAATRPFVAAQVHARHIEKNIVFTVYTAGGEYRAINLFPGRYEASVVKRGFAADPGEVTIEPGKMAVADFALRESSIATTYTGSRTLEVERKVAPYDEIYPPGPGREIVEKYCIVCHGVNYLPGLPRNRPSWDVAIQRMTGTNAWGVKDGASMMPPETVSGDAHETLLAYLSEHFGEDKPVRAVAVDAGTPLDEEALGKAMYIEYLFPNTEEMPNRWTQEPHFDHEGNVWVTERGQPSAITRLDPRTGEIRDYMNPDPNGSPHGLVVDGEGAVWWAGRDVHLARLDPGSGDIRQYPVQSPGLHGHTPVLDSIGDIWFSMLPGNRIGRWDRKNDALSLWQSPSPRGRPYGILVSPDDKIWYVEFHGCQVVRFDPVTETFDEYPALTQPCAIRRLGLDSKGIVWFGVFSAGKLGRLDPASGRVVEYDIPTAVSEPYDTWPDPEDNIWVSDGGQEGALIKFDQQTERFTYYPTPRRTDMPKLAITRDGAIWYAPRMVALTRGGPAGLGVLYPDVSKMKTLAGYY